jgi:hypothetical protein
VRKIKRDRGLRNLFHLIAITHVALIPGWLDGGWREVVASPRWEAQAVGVRTALEQQVKYRLGLRVRVFCLVFCVG